MPPHFPRNGSTTSRLKTFARGVTWSAQNKEKDERATKRRRRRRKETNRPSAFTAVGHKMRPPPPLLPAEAGLRGAHLSSRARPRAYKSRALSGEINFSAGARVFFQRRRDAADRGNGPLSTRGKLSAFHFIIVPRPPKLHSRRRHRGIQYTTVHSAHRQNLKTAQF